MAAAGTARREHEAGLAAFVMPERRTPFRESLDDPRRRRKLQSELCHFVLRHDAQRRGDQCSAVMSCTAASMPAPACSTGST
jgi:hypothetical protein